MNRDKQAQCRSAIIVAGGTGVRMGSDIPKQLLRIQGTPILVLTLRKFMSLCLEKVVLVLPRNQFDTWKSIVQEFKLEKWELELVSGGATRFQSVRNGLKTLSGLNGCVAVHDAVRPFVSSEFIQKAYQQAIETGSAIPAVASKDSIRLLEGGVSKALQRKYIRLVQTPQVFDLKILIEAYQQEECPWFTDDASVFEASGQKVHLIEGEYENIKITTPEDLKIADFFTINKRA